MITLWNNNDHLIELRNLQAVTDGAYENAATVEMVALKDSAGADVGAIWPLAMVYVTGSNGKYRATIPDTLALTVGSSYTATLTANAGAGKQGEWELSFRCRARVL
jgi:hypothetical protein